MTELISMGIAILISRRATSRVVSTTPTVPPKGTRASNPTVKPKKEPKGTLIRL
jgi:hypothetical protein